MQLLFVALMTAVGFILLLACANVAGLLLARGASRGREMAVRIALGATRARIIRQLLVESLLLSVIATAGGLCVALGALRTFTSYVDREPGKPYWIVFTMDWRVFVFLATVCVATTLVFGLAPAMHASRTAPVATLKDGSAGSRGSRRGRVWSGAVVVGEVAVTLVLLVGAGLMIRSFLDAYGRDTGFTTTPLSRMTLYLPEHKYADPAARARFYGRLLDRLQGDATLTVALSSITPGAGNGSPSLVEIDGRGRATDERPLTVPTITASADYFAVLGLAMQRGTTFGASAEEHVAIVNARFAATHWPDLDPVGRTLRISRRAGEGPWQTLTVIGVAPDVQQRLSGGAEPLLYVPHSAGAPTQSVLVARSTEASHHVVARLREEVRALDADIPVFDASRLDDWLASQRWPQRVFGTMFVLFAALGLLLSSLGVYAAVAQAVARRSREMAIRVAVGARLSHVVWLIGRRVVGQIALGLLVGLPAAVVLGRAIPFASQDLGVVPLAAAVVCAAAIAACGVPARRAAARDPLTILRTD